jgi:hypothetical protein
MLVNAPVVQLERLPAVEDFCKILHQTVHIVQADRVLTQSLAPVLIVLLGNGPPPLKEYVKPALMGEVILMEEPPQVVA